VFLLFREDLVIMKRTNISIVLIILLSIAGFFLSYILAQHYYFNDIYLDTGEPLSVFSELGSIACGDASPFISCSKVEESAWAVFMNIPLAIWGIFYFAMLFCVCLSFFFISEVLVKLHSTVLYILLGAGACISLFLFGLSLAVIRALCPLCCGVYAVVTASLIIYLFYYKKNLTSLNQPYRGQAQVIVGNRRYLLLLSFIVVISFITALAVDWNMRKIKGDYTGQHAESRVTALAAAVCSRQPVFLNLKPYCVVGDINAPVVIAEFSDFMCPICSGVAVIIDELLREYPGKVTLAFVNYPLDGSCNVNVRKNLHPGSCMLARGALAASLQGKFYPYMKVVFSARPRTISREELLAFAASAGLDTDTFLKDIDSPLVKDRLQEQIISAVNNGVRSTPSIFINGRLLNYKPSKILLKKIIECELKRAGL
jgi:protein-disulfide isomerase/uncharacterized membrane protein